MIRDYDIPMAQATVIYASPVPSNQQGHPGQPGQHNGYGASAPPAQYQNNNMYQNSPQPINNTYNSTPTVPSQPSSTVNEGGAREFLSGYKWPVGLQDTFVHNLSMIAFRFFICDDSGSMSATDGHKIVAHTNSPNKR